MRSVLDLEKILEREKDEEEEDLRVYFCCSKFMSVVLRGDNVLTGFSYIRQPCRRDSGIY